MIWPVERIKRAGGVTNYQSSSSSYHVKIGMVRGELNSAWRFGCGRVVSGVPRCSGVFSVFRCVHVYSGVFTCVQVFRCSGWNTWFRISDF